MEGLNREECPTSTVGKLAFVGARTGVGDADGLAGLKTQNSSRDLAEGGEESREGGTQARGRWSLAVAGGRGGVGTL